jgi:hypothetical protein
VASVAVILFLAMHSASFRAEPASAAKGADTLASRCAAIDRNPTSISGDVFSCRLERGESDRRLFERATNPDGDPVLEAKHAADAGDFRLMGYSMLVPGIFPAAYGVACRPSIVSQGSRMVRALYAASDVPPVSEVEAANRRRVEEAHRRFGERYNATLMADIRSPFRKTCRAVSRDLETEGGPFRKD